VERSAVFSPATDLAKTGRKESLFKLHIHLTVLGKKRMDPLSLFRGIGSKREINAPDLLKHRWENIVPDQHSIPRLSRA
jgi:hypothetical protein